MEISKPAEKTLQKLWVYWVYFKGNNWLQNGLYDQKAVKELENLKLIETECNEIQLTPKGFEEFTKIIKMHALSEKSEKLIHEILL